MKKVSLFLYGLIIIFSLYCGLSIKADAISINLVDGARIRTEGVQGLRFEASINSTDGVSEYGFYVAKGYHSYDDMTSAISSEEATVGGNKLVNRTSSQQSFAITIYDIDDNNLGTTITVIAYYKVSSTYHFSNICVSRNIAEVARTKFETDESIDFVNEVVDKTKVKVTSSNESVKYFSDLDEFTLADGDMIELVKGTYSPITINKDNVSIYGVQKGVSANAERTKESVISGTINIAASVSGVVIDGVKFSSLNNVLVFNGNTNNVCFVNNICDFEGNEGIKDTNTSSIQTNILIKNNLFNGSNVTYQKSINIVGYISGTVDISVNLFKDALTSVNENDYAIKISKMKDSSYLRIKDNEFNCYGANYLIDLCEGMGSDGIITENNTINIEIDNNKMSETSSKPLQGNGIRAVYLSSNASISIVHNYNFRASAYFNHILLSTGLGANSTTSQYPNVEITYNECYVDPLPGDVDNLVAKPEDRVNDPSKAYIRIGLGLPAESNTYHVDVSKNYYVGETSRYAYEAFNSATWAKNTNQVVLGTDKFNDTSTCDSAYERYFDQKVLVEVAYDYYYQHTEIQYDQRNSRRNLASNPEDATAYRGIYLDCSSYVSALYKYATGSNVTNAADSAQTTGNYETYTSSNYSPETNEGTKVDIIYYFDTSTVNEEDRVGVLETFKNALEVGDIILYRHGDGGHVMIYIGGDTLLHCTGSSFTNMGTGTTVDPTTTTDAATSAERTNGAIQLLAASELFTNTSSARYLFAAEQTSFALLRPLNRGLELSEKAIERYLSKGLTIERTSSKAHMSSVNAGDQITYTMTLKNDGNFNIVGLSASDMIPENTTYVASSITNNGKVKENNITWDNICINAGSSISLTYKVKVNEGTAIGTVITSNSAYVGTIPTNKLYHTVAEYSASQLESLVANAITYVGSTEYSDGFKLFDDIYFDTFGKHLDSSITTSQAAISALIDTANNTKKTNTDLSDMINEDLYGGIKIKAGMVGNNNRIRLVKDTYLEAGDIIILYDAYNKTYQSYMYLGASQDKILSISNGTVSYVYSGSNLDTFLTRVFGYTQWAILRPSLSMFNN
ncbi:MAG: DUF11 domain-containing protein [Bacilli bacterium]|nr:DUF11 domain-containing protein [Bacilli bacterium]